MACPDARLPSSSPLSVVSKNRTHGFGPDARFFVHEILTLRLEGDGVVSRACGRAKLLTHVPNGSSAHRLPTCAEIQSDRRSRDRARWPPGARARGSSPAAEKFADGAFSGPGSAPTRRRPHRDLDRRIHALSRPKPQPITSRSPRLPRLDLRAYTAQSWHLQGQKLRLGGDGLGAEPTYLLYLPSRSRGGI